jgi:endonuclease/exonuclease/phosphatase family metal-dependent hydrolase
MSFRVVTYNLHFGGQGREEALIQVLKALDVDLVVLQEATKPRVVERLAEGIGASMWASRKKLSLGFVSRGAVSQWRWHKMPSLKHAVLEVALHSRSFKVYGVHLRPHLFKWREKQRVGEVKSILEIVSADENRTPHLVVGDFNSVAPGDEARVDLMPRWIRSLIRITGGRVLTEVIERVVEAGYADGFRSLYGDEKGFTFPSFSPRLRLDYAFLSPELQDRLEDCRVVNDHKELKRATDHLPLLTVMRD